MEQVKLLNSRQVAEFVAEGFLRFDAVVPEALNRTVLADFQEGRVPNEFSRDHAILGQGRPVAEKWSRDEAIGEVFRLPVIAGAIHSLVGPGAVYDHHHTHIVPGGKSTGQAWHADAIIDPRTTAFDIQLFYFPHDTPREMGGTMFLPGSHLRLVHQNEIARIQNFRGQVPVVCPAGSIFIAHHGLWHCAQPNHTDRTRSMFKLRLNPARPQVKLWDLGDLDHPDVRNHLRNEHAWAGSESRIELLQRCRLWRHMIDDPVYDFDYNLARQQAGLADVKIR